MAAPAKSAQGITVPPRAPLPPNSVSHRVQATSAPMEPMRSGPAFNLAGAQAFQPVGQQERAY